MNEIEKARFIQQTLELMLSRGYQPGDVPAMKVMATDIIYFSNADRKTRAGMLGALVDIGLPLDVQLPAVFARTKTMKQGVDSMLTQCVDVMGGFPEGLEVLLERGADIHASRRQHYSVLEDAIGQRDKECVRVILHHRTLKEAMGVTEFERNGKQAPKNFLLTYSSLPRGVAGDEAEIVEMLLEAGLPADGLLARACSQFCGDSRPAVDVLVKYGCDINDQSNPPLLVAAGNGKAAMVKRLLELGADPTVKTAKGATVMQCAARYPDVKRVLLAWKSGQEIANVMGAVAAQPTVKRNMGMLPL